MALIITTDDDSQSRCDVAPTSASLRGIPPELRNKTYNRLLTEPRNICSHKLLELREGSPGNVPWEQFQSAIAVHPLTAIYRQMRTEFGSILATTAGQTYHFDVNNPDPHQLAVFRELLATYCFPYETSDKNFPPLLFTEVVLCLNPVSYTHL